MRTRNRNTIVENAPSLETVVVCLDTAAAGRCGGFYSAGDGSAQANNRIIEVAGFHSRSGIEESMSDVANGHGSYNEVTHTRTEWEFPLRSYSALGEDSSYLGRLSRGTTQGSVSAGPSAVQGHTSNSGSWDSDANALARAANTMQFGIQDAGFDLPTFLGELRDFSTLFHSVGKNIKRLGYPKLGPIWERELAKFFRKRMRNPIRQTLRDLATADLFNQFALKPLIADIRAILGTGKHIADQYSRLLRAEPQYVRSSVSDKDNDVFNETSTNHHWTRWNRKTRIITAWAKVELNLSELPPPPLMLVDALGFDNLHKAAWELTRWSFLMDYFVQVGDWLQQFRGQFIDIPHTVLDQGYSRSYECISDVETSFDASTNRAALHSEAVTGSVVNGTCRYKEYKRVKQVLPIGQIAFPTTRLPNLRQVRNISDIAYLLISEGRR